MQYETPSSSVFSERYTFARSLPLMLLMCIIGATRMATAQLSPARSHGPKELISVLEEALRRNGQRFARSSSEWTTQMTPLMPREALAKIYKSFGNPGVWEPSSVALSFDSGRFHAYSQDKWANRRNDPTLVDERSEQAFDGEILERGTPGKQMGRGALKRQDLADFEQAYTPTLHTNYWDAAGWVIPDLMKDFGRPTFIPSPLQHMECTTCSWNVEIDAGNPDNIWFHGEDSIEQSSYLMERSKNYAVVRWERRNKAGMITESCVCSDFAVYPAFPDCWLPTKCDVTCYQFRRRIPEQPSKTPLFVRKYSLTKLEQGRELTKAECRLPRVAGTYVHDGTVGDESIHYKQPASEKELDALVESIKKGTPYRAPNPPPNRTSWTVMIVVANVLVALALVVFYKRNSRGTSGSVRGQGSTGDEGSLRP